MSIDFEKVTIVSIDEELPISVTSKYNPKELSFTKKVNWTGGSGAKMDYPTRQFTNGDPITLTLELFFDEYEDEGDVRPYILKLMQFVHKHDELDNGRPPMVQLIWGGKVGENVYARLSSGIDPLGIGKPFRGVVDSVETKYTMFLEDGTPCRASVKVSLTQADEIEIGAGDETAAQTEEYADAKSAFNDGDSDEVNEAYESQDLKPEDNDPITMIRDGIEQVREWLGI